MEGKGVAFLARQAMAEATHGAAAWHAFLQRFLDFMPSSWRGCVPTMQHPGDGAAP